MKTYSDDTLDTAFHSIYDSLLGSTLLERLSDAADRYVAAKNEDVVRMSPQDRSPLLLELRAAYQDAKLRLKEDGEDISGLFDDTYFLEDMAGHIVKRVFERRQK